MTAALQILNRVLESTPPGDVAILGANDASLLGTLTQREIGELSAKISELGVLEALQREGLFGRKIAIE